jgi:nicotinamide mononucleotide transporter PnuC
MTQNEKEEQNNSAIQTENSQAEPMKTEASDRPSHFKKLFGDWNLFEKLLLSISLIVTVTIFCIGKEKNPISLLSSISGIVCVIFTAKGNPIAQYLSIIFAVFYSIVAWQSRYYGEMLIYLCLMIPIHVACIASWLRNRKNPNSAEVKINSLKSKEYWLMGLADIAVTFAFYFLLKALNTDELIISTISLVSSVSAAYLMLRRSEYYAVCFIVNDLILLVLWGLRVFHYGTSSLPTLITFVVFLINDAYGFIAWRKRKKQQAANN